MVSLAYLFPVVHFFSFSLFSLFIFYFLFSFRFLIGLLSHLSYLFLLNSPSPSTSFLQQPISFKLGNVTEISPCLFLFFLPFFFPHFSLFLYAKVIRSWVREMQAVYCTFPKGKVIQEMMVYLNTYKALL